MSQTPTLEFPPLPEAPKQEWVLRMSPTGRATYEIDRERAIQRDIPPLTKRLRELPGFESVPEEAIQHLAHRWAITLTDTWEMAKQQALDERPLYSGGSGSGLYAHEAVAMEPGAFAGGR